MTSHVERLAASGCKRAVGDRMWCGTCHEPHTNANRTQAACLSVSSGRAPRDECCATCHMPKTAAVDAGHGMFTDHSIPRDPRRVKKAGGRRELEAVIGVADDRAFGIAYAEVGDPRAREFLMQSETRRCRSAAASRAASSRTPSALRHFTPACSATIRRTRRRCSIWALCIAQAGRTPDAAKLVAAGARSQSGDRRRGAQSCRSAAARGRARRVAAIPANSIPGSTAVRARLEALRRTVRRLILFAACAVLFGAKAQIQFEEIAQKAGLRFRSA